MPGQAENAAQVAQEMGTPVPAAPAEVAVAAAPVEAAPAPAPAFASVVFGPREEVVQRLPASNVAPRTPVRMASAKAAPAEAPVSRVAAKGNFFVQLGAYQNAAVAKDAWGRAVRSNASFAAQTPSGMNITSKAGSFYRLSVGGFARQEADALCQSYKAKGGTCFVRAHAGDQVAAWVTPRRPADGLALRHSFENTASAARAPACAADVVMAGPARRGIRAIRGRSQAMPARPPAAYGCRSRTAGAARRGSVAPYPPHTHRG